MTHLEHKTTPRLLIALALAGAAGLIENIAAGVGSASNFLERAILTWSSSFVFDASVGALLVSLVLLAVGLAVGIALIWLVDGNEAYEKPREVGRAKPYLRLVEATKPEAADAPEHAA